MSLAGRLRVLLPPAQLRTYSWICLADSMGMGLFLAGSVVYFTKAIGMNSYEIGTGLTVSMIFGMLSPTPAGRLGDRLGHRQTLCALNVLLALGFAGYPFVRDYAEFVVIVSLIAFGKAATIPVRRGLLSQLAQADERVRASAYNRALCNVGFSVGAGAATAGLAVGGNAALQLIVFGNAALLAIAAVMTRWLPPDTRERRVVSAGAKWAETTPAPYRDGRFLAVSLLSGLIATHESILAVGLPLLILRLGGPAWAVSAVLLGNTILTVMFQVPASRGAEGLSRGARALFRAGVALCCCTFLLAGSSAIGRIWALALVAAATAVLTFGELQSSAGSWSLSFALAAGPRQGEYLGVFTMIQQAAGIAGPLLVAAVVESGAQAWLALGAGYLVVGLLARYASPQLRGERPETPSALPTGSTTVL
jgi:MFS family permease